MKTNSMKSRTYFEQVPIAVAKQIAREEASTVLPVRPSCWICSIPVRLERCKIDEYGRAVHETCHVSRLAAAAHCLPQTAVMQAKPSA